jgi:hypothetical protein
MNTPNLVPGKVEPSIGSVKSIKIDGILSEKYVYDGKRWNHACKFNNCLEEPKIGDLCIGHHNWQIKFNIDGEKTIKGTQTFKWVINEWKQMCSTYFCDNFATGTGFCKNHGKNKTMNMRSSHQTLANIFSGALQDYNISLQKKDRFVAEGT